MDYNTFKEQLLEELKYEYKDKYITSPEDVFQPDHKERRFKSLAFLEFIKIVEDFKPKLVNQ
jgi:hypothetical protein